MREHARPWFKHWSQSYSASDSAWAVFLEPIATIGPTCSRALRTRGGTHFGTRRSWSDRSLPLLVTAGVVPTPSVIIAHFLPLRLLFMELEKSFNPRQIESRWYAYWESSGFFRPTPGDTSETTPAYCIMLPPPNVTGTLHMGHAFQHTLMDALTRYHRMRGDNTL